MAKIQVWRGNLERARDRSSLTDEELDVVKEMLGDKTGNVTIEVERLPLNYARSLLDDPKLTANQRGVLALYVHGLTKDELDCDGIYSLRVSNPLEFGSTMTAMARSRANAELSWNGRWYPVRVLVEIREDDQKLARHVFTRVVLSMGSVNYDVQQYVDPAIFSDEPGNPSDVSVLQVLERLGFRRLQTPAGEYNLRLVNAERLAASVGTQVWVKGAVLELERRMFFGSQLTELPLGTPEMPRRAVVEPTLAASEASDGYTFNAYRMNLREDASRVPLVRIFSLDIKSYVFADVDDLALYEYQEESLAKLYLPPAMKSVLQKVFETPADQLFGDLIRGKHGGIVILACGSPGVGKTFTAEVYAEMTHRPLYVLEFGELGTTVETIEENLRQVFARVVRWRAVLQFDECEIFLAQRGEDLERSAIVGIFLRMLDYYEGLLFLTTNRPEVLDHAIRSRVMLRLEYPDLDHDGRKKVWETMFEAAGLRLTDGGFSELAEQQVHGRQIRNLVRLARILHPERTITLKRMIELLEYGCR